MGNLTLGIDIGGTNFRIGAVDEAGSISHFEKNSSRIFDTGDVVEIIKKEIDAYMDRYGIRDSVRAVAVGIPSIVSKDKKTIISTPNLKGFNNIRFSDKLSEKLNIPVFLDRDVNFLLMNDMKKLKIDNTKTVLGFYIGTGFGNAMCINGKLYAGKNGAAGELGHIPLYCGNIGCSETRCSGKRLEYLCEKYFPDVPIREVFKYHGNSPIIIKFVKDLAIPIATEINILDPDYSIIAGGVALMEDFPKELLIEAIHEKVRKPYPEENLEIMFSEHDQQSGIFGSGIYAHEMLKNII